MHFSGQTPIHYAAKLGHYECLNILLSLPSADINVKDKDGHTALDLAKMANVRN